MQEVGRVSSRLSSGFVRDSEPQEQQQHRYQQHLPELGAGGKSASLEYLGFNYRGELQREQRCI